MGLIAWLILGFVAGWLAQFVVKEEDRGCGCTGVIFTVIVGLAGAAVGGWIGTQLGWGGVNDLDLRSIGLAFLGSVVVLLIVSAVRGRRR